MNLVPANSPEQLRQVRQLFEEYATSLPFDLCFQNFQQELDGLPGDYAPPEGGLWLAITDHGEVAGCVALRRLEPGIGEMKRLYVRPEHRGTGLGKRLARTVLEEAESIGYLRIRLDTTPDHDRGDPPLRVAGFHAHCPIPAQSHRGSDLHGDSSEQ